MVNLYMYVERETETETERDRERDFLVVLSMLYRLAKLRWLWADKR